MIRAHKSRRMVVVVHDAMASFVAWYLAYWLRFNLTLPPAYLASASETVLWVVPLQYAIFQMFGLYRGLWRFASLPDLTRIVKAVGVTAVASPVVLILFQVTSWVPRSVLILDPLILLLILGGSRLVYRAWRDRGLGALLSDSRPALLLGAGSAADILLREMTRHASGLRVIGLLDDDPEKIGRHIQGLPVLGGLDQLGAVTSKKGVRDLILAIPSATPALRKRIVGQCADLGLNLLTVPSMDDLLQGRVSVASLRKIELDDLLGREPVKLDNAGLKDLLSGNTILVTGAGGSIGSELCRQIAYFKPGRILLLEQGEFVLYRMEQEFRLNFPEVPITCLIADVKDGARIGHILSEYHPAMVFHAAAYKHVPLMEENNAMQALRNNVLGTWVVAREAKAAGVRKFVLISTDKAVNPTSVMGASKRLAEMVCQALQRNPALPEAEAGTRFISVRFGNVLGSSGSVVPKFQKQIAAGGPITVTHPDITRYFMSIPEAAQLVLQAGLMGKGGEIFVLDMGEPVKIVDLARLMIRLAGRAEEEIGIEYSGLRPGEKLYEELLADKEMTLPTPHPKLRVGQSREVDEGMLETTLTWLSTHAVADDASVRQLIKQLIPEYIERDKGAH